MKKIIKIILLVLLPISYYACSDDNQTFTEPTTWYQDCDGDGLGNPEVSQESFNQPDSYVTNNTDTNDIILLREKIYTTGDVINYYYDSQDRLELKVHNYINSSSNDSTYIEYTSGTISKIRNTKTNYDEEYVFNSFNSISASGSLTQYHSSGLSDEYEFEYKFNGDLITEYSVFFIGGILDIKHYFFHNNIGNLISIYSLNYYNGGINDSCETTITEWDTKKGLEERELPNCIQTITPPHLPGFTISKNNWLNASTQWSTQPALNYNYSFEYNECGYVTKYTNTDNSTSLVLLNY